MTAIIDFSTSNNIVIIYYKYNIISEASPFKIEKNEPDNDDTLSNFSPTLERVKKAHKDTKNPIPQYQVKLSMDRGNISS